MTLPGPATWQPWSYGDESMLSSAYDLSGYGIAAADGEIGKVDEATYDVGSSYVVVDTGPWIFGKKVMLPAAVIQRVDLDSQTVVVDRTKDEIKNSPEFDEDAYQDQGYRSQLGSYYYSDTDR